MVRVAHSIDLAVRADALDSLTAFDRDTRAFPDLRVTSDVFDGYQVGSLTLPSDGTPMPLTLGGLADVRGCYVEVRGLGAAALWLNVTGPVQGDTPGALAIKPSATSASGNAQFAHFYADVGVSSLWLASTGAVVLTGSYAVWGYTRQQGA